MLMQSSCRKNEKGIGLLELMLSLSIIAILLVMATRYFLVANESQKINNAVSMVNGIIGGAAQYAVVQHSYTSMDMKALIDGNYIPNSMGGSDNEGTGANPWNGNLTVEPATAGSGYTVKVTGVPKDGSVNACTKMAGILNGSIKGSAVCDSGTVTVTITS